MTLPKLWQLPEDRLLAEQLRLLYGNVGVSVIPAFLVALVLLYTLENDSNRTMMLLWSAAVLTTKLLSAVDARRHLATPIAPAQARRLVALLIVVHTLDGAAWGALAWVALGSTAVAGNIMVLAILTGIVGSSMSLLAPVLVVFICFAAALVALVMSWFWLSGDSTYKALAVTGFLYLVSLVGQAHNSSQAALAAIRLRFENIDLVKAANAARRNAEYANLAKSKFLAAASHDLRQPIHAQGLFLDVLSRTPLSPHQTEVLASTQSAWQASSDMLNTLLDFSRIEAGVVQPKLQPFGLQNLLHQIENDLAPLADAKGLVYRSRETTVPVLSDATLVGMILRNLVSNAIRYTQHGGVLVACRLRQQTICIEVWDTGIGIAAADQVDIFREFHQLGNPERDRHKGLGLGLAIAEGLAKALGHRLWLSSTPGRGSVFRLELPQSSVAMPATELLPDGQALQQVRVLVIDDDDAVRSAMAHLLRSWGCQCHTAGSIDEALDLASAQALAIIISDYRLRGLRTGAHAIADVRALLGTDTPAFIVTGDTAPERLREASASGIPLLHKPLLPDQLYRALVEAIP